ncbi:MAG: glutamine synthetase family protein [Pseudomonadota bacterium]
MQDPLADKSGSHQSLGRVRRPSLYAVVCDLNGVYRGKRVPPEELEALKLGKMKLPLATLFLDIWGRDVIGSGQILETGDIDGVLVPISEEAPVLRHERAGSDLMPLWMHQSDGSPYGADPRHALASVCRRYHDRGWTPVCAMEMEFCFYHPPREEHTTIPGLFRATSLNAMYSIDELKDIDHILDDIYAICEKADIPVGAIVSEGGCGQFEINLDHRPDALRAADDAQRLKYIVKDVAREHGLGATFMAKPFGDQSGNGLHTHISVLDETGANIFDNGAAEGTDVLRHAVGGLLSALPSSMLLFAPHANSYRRLREGTHAPTTVSWGYDNRTASIRIPSSSHKARRIEHRVAGADANPYLVLAAIMGALIAGVEQKIEPQAPLQGNAYASGHHALPTTWQGAIEAFEASGTMGEIFDPLLKNVYAACKRQELDRFADMIPITEYEAYLGTV